MRLALALSGGFVAIGVACNSRSAVPMTPLAEIAGVWNAEFVVDSFILAQRPPHSAPAVGLVTFADTTRLAGARGELAMATTMSVDFRPALGRRISCLDSAGTETTVAVRNDSVHLNFTPHVADCGLHAVGHRHGDTISGRWVEPGFATLSLGHFRLVRRR